MDTYIDIRIKEALQDLDSLKSPDCLDDDAISAYAENTLNDEDRRNAEMHLQNCLYCLNRLNEMTEMLYCLEHPVPVPDELMNRLQSLIPPQEETKSGKKPSWSLWNFLRQLLIFPIQEWRYTTVGMVSAALGVVFCLFVVEPTHHLYSGPHLNPDAFVNIAALGDDGRVLKEDRGVIMNAKGYIASNLKSITGAAKLRVVQRNGKSYQIDKVWADENRNLAVMKLDTESASALPISDIKQVVGNSLFIVTDPANSRNGMTESIVSDLHQVPGKHSNRPTQYISIASMTTKSTGGALVDNQGKLVGLLITQDKKLNMAAPITDIERLYKEGKAISLHDLKKVAFSSEALESYLKGVLASDDHQWDEARQLLEKAVRLNPRLDGAYQELGHVYYRLHDYVNEARAYEAALAINPENSDALLCMAWNLDSRQEFRKAISFYERAYQLEPDNPEILFRLGLAHLAQGEKQKALSIYGKLRALDPGNAELLRRLAR